MRIPRAAPLLLFAALAGCRYDPVPQEKLDALPEEPGEPSARHRPGQACVLCHDAYEGAEPKLAIGGTVYHLGDAGLEPASGAYVIVTDSAGDFRGLCTNDAGNFFVKAEDWTEIIYPLRVQVNDRPMRSLVGRDGSCATCHRLPDKDSLVPETGASRDSAGVVLVDQTEPDVNCGGAP
jgi:hypothetical protein